MESRVRERTTAGTRRAGARVLVLAALGALVWPAIADAVSVSPVALYLDHRRRTTTLTLYNPGDRPEEIEVGFAFGHARSDSTGRVAVEFTEDPAPEGRPSVVPYLRAFPRRLRLGAGERQVVRVMVTPPADLEDGEYWGRVMVTSRGGQRPVEERQGDIQMQIELTTVVAVAVNYRHGQVSTGLRLEEARAVETAGTVDLVTRIDHTGNAAYLGRLTAEIVAADGEVLAAHEEDMVAYEPTLWRFSIPKPAGGIGPGAEVRFRFEAERDGAPDDAILPAEPVTGTAPIGAASSR
jgi:P pilus assembly chaperone PapD